MDGILGQTQLYQGATPTFEAPQQQGVQAHTVDVSDAARSAGATLNKGVKLLDFYQQMKEEYEQVAVATERAKDYQNRMAKAAGTAGSFLNKDGSVNEAEVSKFNETWAEKFRGTRRMRFDGDAALRAKDSLENTIREWGQQTETQVNADMLRNTKDIWETRMKIFEANGDTASMREHLQRGLEAGLLREDEVELMRVRMAKSAARAGGGGADIRSVEQLRALRDREPLEMYTREEDATELTSSDVLNEDGTSMTFAEPDGEQRMLTFADADIQDSVSTIAAQREFDAAMAKKKEPHDLSKAEGLLEKGNIDPYSRKVEHRADGSIATVESFSVNIDGKEVLLPRVIDGKTVSMDEAIEHYEKTGEHLGKFDTPEHASDYAQKFHENQAVIYGTGANPFSDESLRTDGFRILDSSEFEATRAADVAQVRRGSVTLDARTGRDVLSAPMAASDATFTIVDTANALEGYEQDAYGSDIKKITMRYKQDKNMAGMSRASLKKAIKDDVTIEYGADRWFNGDTIAYEGFIETEIDKVLDVADGAAFKHFGAQAQSISSVDDVRGLVRSGVLHESFLTPMDIEGALNVEGESSFGMFAPVVIGLAGPIASIGWMLNRDSSVSLKGENIEIAKELWNKYGDAYLRETGKEKGKGFDEHYEGFKAWATGKDGIVKQEQKAYATAVKDIVEGRISEALTEYYANGGTSEAEAIAYVKKALKRPLAEAEMGTQASIASEREKREDKSRALAKKFATDFADAKKRVTHYQTRAGEAKAAEEKKVAEKKEAEKERKKLDKADEKERKKLVSPMKQRVRWDGGKDKTPFVTVPEEMYEQLLSAVGTRRVLGLPTSTGGVGVLIDGGSGRVIPVRAGKVRDIQFSHGVMLQEWPRATKREARGLVNGVNKLIQFLPY